MKLRKNELSINCEFGACANIADYAIEFEKTGADANVYVCRSCLVELRDAISAQVAPKSCETYKNRRAK